MKLPDVKKYLFRLQVWIRENPGRTKLALAGTATVFMGLFIFAGVIKYLSAKNPPYAIMVDGRIVMPKEFLHYCRSIGEQSGEVWDDIDFKLRCAKILSEFMAVQEDASAAGFLEDPHFKSKETALRSDILVDRYISFRYPGKNKKEAFEIIDSEIRQNEMQISPYQYALNDAKNENLHKKQNYLWDVEFQRMILVVEIFIAFKIRENVSVTPAEVAASYNEEKESFREGEKYLVDLVSFKYRYNAVAFEAAIGAVSGVDLAAEAGKRFSGDDFVSVSREVTLKEEEMKPEIVNFLKPMGPGQISGILDTDGGFAIYRLVSREPSRYLPLREVSDLLYTKIFNRRRAKYAASLKASIDGGHKISINRKRIITL